jgi:hypothetical protein
MAKKIAKKTYVWVLHGPNGQRETFLGSRNHPGKAAKEFFAKVPDAEKPDWVIESYLNEK